VYGKAEPLLTTGGKAVSNNDGLVAALLTERTNSNRDRRLWLGAKRRTTESRNSTRRYRLVSVKREALARVTALIWEYWDLEEFTYDLGNTI